MSARSPKSDQSGTKEQEFRSRSVYTSPKLNSNWGTAQSFFMGQGDCLLGRTLTNDHLNHVSAGVKGLLDNILEVWEVFSKLDAGCAVFSALRIAQHQLFDSL
jgi:hypothetical protein